MKSSVLRSWTNQLLKILIQKVEKLIEVPASNYSVTNSRDPVQSESAVVDEDISQQVLLTTESNDDENEHPSDATN